MKAGTVSVYWAAKYKHRNISKEVLKCKQLNASRAGCIIRGAPLAPNVGLCLFEHYLALMHAREMPACLPIHTKIFPLFKRQTTSFQQQRSLLRMQILWVSTIQGHCLLFSE